MFYINIWIHRIKKIALGVAQGKCYLHPWLWSYVVHRKKWEWKEKFSLFLECWDCEWEEGCVQRAKFKGKKVLMRNVITWMNERERWKPLVLVLYLYLYIL